MQCAPHTRAPVTAAARTADLRRFTAAAGCGGLQIHLGSCSNAHGLLHSELRCCKTRSARPRGGPAPRRGPSQRISSPGRSGAGSLARSGRHSPRRPVGWVCARRRAPLVLRNAAQAPRRRAAPARPRCAPPNSPFPALQVTVAAAPGGGAAATAGGAWPVIPLDSLPRVPPGQGPILVRRDLTHGLTHRLHSGRAALHSAACTESAAVRGQPVCAD